MEIIYEGQSYPFIPQQQFRALHDLPEDFGLSLFESKDYNGLARMDAAAPALRDLHQQLLAHIPEESLRIADLLPLGDVLQTAFEEALRAINDQIGLRESELGFAVAGFGDVLNAYLYALIRALLQQDSVDFEQIYEDWLQSTNRLSQQEHSYSHHGETWQLQVLNNIYGRIGLCIHQGETVYFVADRVYACPADRSMYRLLSDLAAHIGAIAEP